MADPQRSRLASFLAGAAAAVAPKVQAEPRLEAPPLRRAVQAGSFDELLSVVGPDEILRRARSMEPPEVPSRTSDLLARICSALRDDPEALAFVGRMRDGSKSWSNSLDAAFSRVEADSSARPIKAPADSIPPRRIEAQPPERQPMKSTQQEKRDCLFGFLASPLVKIEVSDSDGEAPKQIGWRGVVSDLDGSEHSFTVYGPPAKALAAEVENGDGARMKVYFNGDWTQAYKKPKGSMEFKVSRVVECIVDPVPHAQIQMQGKEPPPRAQEEPAAPLSAAGQEGPREEEGLSKRPTDAPVLSGTIVSPVRVITKRDPGKADPRVIGYAGVVDDDAGEKHKFVMFKNPAVIFGKEKDSIPLIVSFSGKWVPSRGGAEGSMEMDVSWINECQPVGGRSRSSAEKVRKDSDEGR